MTTKEDSKLGAIHVSAVPGRCGGRLPRASRGDAPLSRVLVGARLGPDLVDAGYVRAITRSKTCRPSIRSYRTGLRTTSHWTCRESGIYITAYGVSSRALVRPATLSISRAQPTAPAPESDARSEPDGHAPSRRGRTRSHRGTRRSSDALLQAVQPEIVTHASNSPNSTANACRLVRQT
jgi:regulator of extracellular matrix RemA (YlzA/DUF370 family)